MTNLLKEISEKAIKYEDFGFTSEQIKGNWLGTTPATQKQIIEAENRLGVKLPDDYKEFLSITNGFYAPNDIEPSFENIENIDFLKNIDKDTIEAYNDINLENSIVVGGLNEEQYFLLIPPVLVSDNWKYWKFANWIPGEHAFENLYKYFSDVLDFINNEYEK